MKTLLKRIALLTSSLLIFAVPVLADEGAMVNPVAEPEQQMEGKDQCLLASRNCAGSVDSIYERINRIQGELNKGTSVYSNDELRRLQNSLDEENKFLNDLVQGG